MSSLTNSIDFMRQHLCKLGRRCLAMLRDEESAPAVDAFDVLDAELTL